jgi:hypothetical protein
MADYLEREHLCKQVVTVKKIGDLVTKIKRVGGEGGGLGVYLLDKELEKVIALLKEL